MAFKLRSGNKPSFKMMGSKSPAKQRTIVGENTSEILKDKKGEDYSLALHDTDAGINKGDTIRPGKAPRVGNYIMGGDYDLKKKGDKNYEIKSPAKQRSNRKAAKAAKVAAKAAVKGAQAADVGKTGKANRKAAKAAGAAAASGTPMLKKKKYEVETAHGIETAGGGKSDHITFTDKKGKSVDYQQHKDAGGNVTTYKTKYSNKRGKDGSYQTKRKTVSNKKGERQIKRKLSKQK